MYNPSQNEVTNGSTTHPWRPISTQCCLQNANFACITMAKPLPRHHGLLISLVLHRRHESNREGHTMFGNRLFDVCLSALDRDYSGSFRTHSTTQFDNFGHPFQHCSGICSDGESCEYQAIVRFIPQTIASNSVALMWETSNFFCSHE